MLCLYLDLQRDEFVLSAQFIEFVVVTKKKICIRRWIRRTYVGRYNSKLSFSMKVYKVIINILEFLKEY